jgi:hypothetical protein
VTVETTLIQCPDGARLADVHYKNGQLAVTVDTHEARPHVFQVTHLLTGRKIVQGFFKFDLAKAFLDEILPLTDWGAVKDERLANLTAEQKAELSKKVYAIYEKHDALDEVPGDTDQGEGNS